MRVIKEIAHPDYRTTIFQWNNKYIIKMETAMLEQTFKVDQYELASDEDAVKLLDDEFVKRAMDRFGSMASDFGEALRRLD